jgi:uncharacterized protein
VDLAYLVPSRTSVENVVLGLGILVAFFAVTALIQRRLPDLRYAGLVLAALLVAHLALFIDPIRAFFPHADATWNWGGKLLSTVVTLLCVALIPAISWRDAGFTWRQRGVRRAILAAIVMCAFGWAIGLLLTGFHTTVPSTEALLYQATMPGLHEEPLYRGLALVLIERAFWNEGWDFLGARIGWGAILTSIWFGTIHGVGLSHGHFMFDWVVIAITGIIGFFLAWIRMRTGSLVIPVGAHNVINIGNQFIG